MGHIFTIEFCTWLSESSKESWCSIFEQSLGRFHEMRALLNGKWNQVVSNFLVLDAMGYIGSLDKNISSWIA